jgi:hypothetical protein
MGTTGGAGIAYLSGAHEFTTVVFLLRFCSVLWTIVVESLFCFLSIKYKYKSGFNRNPQKTHCPYRVLPI